MKRKTFLKDEDQSPISPSRKTKKSQINLKRITAMMKRSEKRDDMGNLIPTDGQVNTEDAESIFERFE